jgi:surface protein
MSFIFKITTTTSPQTFTIPCSPFGTFNATVDYGDGTGSQTVTAYNDSNLTHSFATAGQYTITIDGTFPNIRFSNNATSAALVDEVVDLGDVGWLMLYAGFQGCTNLTSFSTGTANTANNAFVQSMFRNCTSLTSVDLTNFDTSNATNFSNMFENCSSLTTLDLSSFDTSSVTIMQLMFYRCLNLTTLDVSSFDTSSVTYMQLMFYRTNLTDLDIKHFDVSSVITASNFLLLSNNALTTAAYDELLEAWAVQDVQPNVTWHFGDAQYTVVNIADWYSPKSASSLSIIDNKLVSIADSTAIFGAAQQINNLVVGNVYSFIATATCNNNSATVSLVVSAGAVVGSPIFNKQATGSVTADDAFTATATTHYVGTVVTGHAANDTVTIDAGITVKEITNYAAANAASNTENSEQANNSVAYQNIAQTSDVRDTYTLSNNSTQWISDLRTIDIAEQS